jgi:hypothetical protein
MIGSRAQVMNGTATQTSGGLKMGDLKRVTTGKGVSKRTKIVPKLKSSTAKRNMPPQLWRASLKEYGLLQKGDFCIVKRGTADHRAVTKIYQAKLRKAGLA